MTTYSEFVETFGFHKFALNTGTWDWKLHDVSDICENLSRDIMM